MILPPYSVSFLTTFRHQYHHRQYNDESSDGQGQQYTSLPLTKNKKKSILTTLQETFTDIHETFIYMEHIALEIFDLDGIGGSKFAYLEKDAGITITDTSEIFASGDVWSHPFTLNIHANSHIFGTSGEMHGSRLHEQINKRRVRLWVEGLPLYLGCLKLDDEVDVNEDGDVDVTFESGKKTFDEMIEGGKANQVPMMSDVRFGIALWRKRWVHVGYQMTAEAVLSDGSRTKASKVTRELTEYEKQQNVDDSVIDFTSDGEYNPIQEYPRMVFPQGRFKKVDSDEIETINCINTDYPYDDEHPYCNVALCYQKHGYEKYKNENDKTETYNDYSSEPEPMRGYETMPANRVNSAPNFYVIYWIRSLMKHLGITIEENQMMDVEDLRRLFFVNTKCAYKEPKYIRNSTPESGICRYKFISGRRLVGETFAPQAKKQGTLYYIHERLTKINDSGFTSKSFTAGTPIVIPETGENDVPSIDRIIFKITKVLPWNKAARDQTEDMNNYLHDAIATSDCFPDVDISEVVHAMENAFGVRFIFNDNYQRVRILLLRNIFRCDEVQNINCDIISETKTENAIRGFRMTYGKSEDTHFYYKGFADMMPHKTELWADTSDKHDYSHWDTQALYSNIIHKVSAFDKTCYITPDTGNAFGIKVDKDAKRYEDLHPSLFEFAGFMDAEDGDCTGDPESIEEISVGFTPAIMNDLNMESEREGEQTQKFALFVDETMRPRRPDLLDGTDYNNPDAVYDVDDFMYGKNVTDSIKKMMHDGVVKPGEFSITSDMYGTRSGLKASFELHNHFSGGKYVKWNVTNISIEGHVNEGYRLYLQDNFEPNDDGISPIETHDWGLTLGIMRGSGSDAHVRYESDIDDNEGNDTWEVEPGNSATAHPDICDCYGNLWDYNGSVLISDGGTAVAQLQRTWPNSNIDLVNSNGTTRRNKDTYISSAAVQSVTNNVGARVNLLFATSLGSNGQTVLYTGRIKDYAKKLNGMTTSEMFAYDSGTSGFGILIETNSSIERKITLLALQKRAFVDEDNTEDPIVLDGNGIGSTEGRISLKLRAEKPNPNFNAKNEESESNRRYLQIANRNLRGRGLSDQFYKEYSYWVRNARIYKCTVRTELSQLLSIDKTQRVIVGDISGFIRKMQYTVSNDGGLGLVTMEIMYI